MAFQRTLLRGTPEEYLKKYGSDILEDPRFLVLKTHTQHHNTTAYDHAVTVTLKALDIAIEQGLKVDAASLVRGSLLHDYWGYDCHAKGHPKFHLIRHDLRAAKKAMEDFGVNPIEADMIANHMWPLHPHRFPTCIEGWILVIADKKVSVRERFNKKHVGLAAKQRP